MPRKLGIMLLGLAVTIFTATARTRPRTDDPLFEISYDPQLVMFEQTPAPTRVRSLAISRANRRLLEHLGSYPNLEILSVTCLENLKTLPDALSHLTKLKDLEIDSGNGCAMNPALPEDFGNLRSLTKLVLYGAQDPRTPGRRPRERHKFPQSMSQLKNLTYLDLGRNGLREIPSFVGHLPKLRELRFEWNGLKELPRFVSHLHELRVLRLKGNDLDNLPNSLDDLPKLTLVTLGNNCTITQSAAKMKRLKERFPKVTFDFIDEYDCPGK